MGTGYTRNDTANNIADGNVINASDLDGEFDAIQSAFNGTTGHSHDGTTGEGPQIDTAGIADNAVTLGTKTSGNYVAAGAVSGVGLSGSASAEGATFTVTSNATNANTASTIVSRDASGNFSAGTITAALSGNATTATTLATARTIAGQSFDGSANISIAPTDLTGVTASAAELNILDGVTATTAELNFVDGVTSNIQTQINNIDTDLLNDTTPQLGGNLDVNGNSIVSASAGNISITPDTTGSVIIDGLSHPQSDGTAGQFMKTDGAGNLSFATVDLTAINIVDDTTPQLGGDLDTNGNAIAFGTSKWTIELDTGDNDLLFKYNGTTVFKLASNGAVTSADDITAFGTP